jgi:tRNA threonylcarbamoyladenosine biosynthesis protein TsaE
MLTYNTLAPAKVYMKGKPAVVGCPPEHEALTTQITITTSGADETRLVGAAMGRAAQPGDVILLHGELGAGKTTLTQGILRGLGGDDYASSPTFVLISEYTARLTLYHVDLYRISKPEDTFELGLDEILDGDGLCVVEWAERALDQFPAERLTVELLRTGDETRSLAIEASGSDHTRYLQEISAVGTPQKASNQASTGAEN